MPWQKASFSGTGSFTSETEGDVSDPNSLPSNGNDLPHWEISNVKARVTQAGGRGRVWHPKNKIRTSAPQACLNPECRYTCAGHVGQQRQTRPCSIVVDDPGDDAGWGVRASEWLGTLPSQWESRVIYICIFLRWLFCVCWTQCEWWDKQQVPVIGQELCSPPTEGTQQTSSNGCQR